MKIITRAAVTLALVIGAVFIIGGPSYAAVPTFAHVAAAASADAAPIVVDLDVAQLLNLLIAVIFPVLVGLVTTRVTSPAHKAILLATISLASGLVSGGLAALTAGIAFDIVSALLTGLAAWIIAIATHYGFWKPSGVSERVQAVGSTSTQG